MLTKVQVISLAATLFLLVLGVGMEVAFLRSPGPGEVKKHNLREEISVAIPEGPWNQCETMVLEEENLRSFAEVHQGSLEDWLEANPHLAGDNPRVSAGEFLAVPACKVLLPSIPYVYEGALYYRVPATRPAPEYLTFALGFIALGFCVGLFVPKEW